MKQKNIHMSALNVKSQLIQSESHVTSDVKMEFAGIPATKTSAFNASAVESKETIRQESMQQYLQISQEYSITNTHKVKDNQNELEQHRVTPIQVEPE